MRKFGRDSHFRQKMSFSVRELMPHVILWYKVLYKSARRMKVNGIVWWALK